MTYIEPKLKQNTGATSEFFDALRVEYDPSLQGPLESTPNETVQDRKLIKIAAVSIVLMCVGIGAAPFVARSLLEASGASGADEANPVQIELAPSR